MPEHTTSFFQSSPEVKVKVLQWLREDGWLVNEQSSPGLAWLLIGTKNGPPLLVGEMEGADHLMLRYQVTLATDDHQRLQSLARDRQAEFVWDLWSGLLGCGVEFAIPDPIPKEILLTVTLYYDALSKDTFMQRFVRLNTASNLVSLVFRKAFRKLLEPFGQGIAN